LFCGAIADAVADGVTARAERDRAAGLEMSLDRAVPRAPADGAESADEESTPSDEFQTAPRHGNRSGARGGLRTHEMSVDASSVKELRERTGAGMMDCKRALGESNGDLDKAISLLREKGLASAAKKAGRVAAEGLVSTFTNDDHTRAVVAELNCETDFVAKTPEFGKLLAAIGEALLVANGIALEGRRCGRGIAQAAVRQIAGGSSERSRRVDRREHRASALHAHRCARRSRRQLRARGRQDRRARGSRRRQREARGRAEVARDANRCAMPRYVRREEVTSADLAGEREIFRSQAAATGKPANVVEKIVDGKVEKFYREVCLLEQEYVRDPQLTVDKLLAAEAKQSGGSLTVRRFVRYQLGEGIEKRTSNLAAEVAEQLAKG
jgi:elongation factor Ts